MLKSCKSAMGVLRKLQAMHEDDLVATLYKEALNVTEGCANEYNDRNNAVFFLLDVDKHIGVQLVPMWDYCILECTHGEEVARVRKY